MTDVENRGNLVLFDISGNLQDTVNAHGAIDGIDLHLCSDQGLPKAFSGGSFRSP